MVFIRAEKRSQKDDLWWVTRIRVLLHLLVVPDLGLCQDPFGVNIAQPKRADTPVFISRPTSCQAEKKFSQVFWGFKGGGLNVWSGDTISAPVDKILSAAKTLLSGFQGSPLYDEIAGVIDFVTDTQNVGKSALLNRIAIPPAPRFAVDRQVWGNVLQALQGNCIIEFDYTGRWNSDMTHRRVRPYQLLLDDGVCYLYGFAEEREDTRLFVLSRMKKLKITSDRFKLPADYEMASQSGGGRFGTFASKDLDKYVIDFYGDARPYIKERVWADDQKITDFDDEDRTRIEFSSTQFRPIQYWVLSQGGNAIPREPEWLVEEWQDQIKQMVKNIKK